MITEGNITDNIQGGQEIEHELVCGHVISVNYVWSTNIHDTNHKSIQYTQNKAQRIATDCHKMSSVDHLHVEAEMLKVREHSELQFARLDVWNQIMSATPSPQGTPLRDG